MRQRIPEVVPGGVTSKTDYWKGWQDGRRYGREEADAVSMLRRLWWKFRGWR